MFADIGAHMPLAARLRPTTLDDVAGQRHLLARGRALREAIERGDTGSILFWGPPGTGKTTLAGIIARHLNGEFVRLSAVTDGVARIREVVAEAERRRVAGHRTIVFIDEIHRFNRGQQDALLPHLEAGTLTLIGATTENPSFELNGALLSRLRVFVLEPLSVEDLTAVLRRAAADKDHGLGTLGIAIDDEALELLAVEADGDARRALSALDAAVVLLGPSAAPSTQRRVTVALVRDAVQWRAAQYDKSGEQHYNLISAYHKALRGSDPQGALYWLARMIEGGEDPMYIARRTVRFATEDIGLADPQALTIAIAAREAFHLLGAPEGELALAEAAIYLACAPKSNRVYAAWSAACEAARHSPAAAVPLHLRNAPTALMKDLGYGAGYQYAHTVPDAYIPQDYLPDELRGRIFYAPGPFGFERDIEKRLEWWASRRTVTAQGAAPVRREESET